MKSQILIQLGLWLTAASGKSLFVPLNLIDSCAHPEGGQGVQTPPPLKNHRNIRFLSNTGPDSLENHAIIQRWAIVGPHSKKHFNIGIKHVYLCINICWIPRVMLNPSLKVEGFNGLRGLANVKVSENHV